MRLATLLLLTRSLSAQSPYEVAPENYQKLFEDEYFRVSKATYRPGDKIKFHAHPLTATVYVYLTDSGPVRFFHAGGGGITRAAVAGHRPTGRVQKAMFRPRLILAEYLANAPLGIDGGIRRSDRGHPYPHSFRFSLLRKCSAAILSSLPRSE